MSTQVTTDSSNTTHAALNGISLSVSLTVKDLEQSVHWYSDIVGFAVDQKYEREGQLRGVVVRAGAVRVLLNKDDGGRGWDRVKGEGFSLQIITDQSIDAVASAITARGGVLGSEPADMPWGARVFRLSDPDGYRWTISSPRAG